ncbi:MAG: hypothetical protein N2045_00750 [Fimbriimonadales bacterium]|jgi:hypothetical protein|nr:hypothetical protein [Fimbriimonadales bacterium]
MLRKLSLTINEEKVMRIFAIGSLIALVILSACKNDSRPPSQAWHRPKLSQILAINHVESPDKALELLGRELQHSNWLAPDPATLREVASKLEQVCAEKKHPEHAIEIAWQFFERVATAKVDEDEVAYFLSLRAVWEQLKDTLHRQEGRRDVFARVDQLFQEAETELKAMRRGSGAVADYKYVVQSNKYAREQLSALRKIILRQ